jgi:hypothetical protein
LQNQLQEKKNKSLQGNNTNNISNISINSNLNKYTQQANLTSNLNIANSNNSQINKNTFNINSNRNNYPNTERDNSNFLNQQTNYQMNNINYNNSNSRSNRDNFNDCSVKITTYTNTSNIAGNLGNKSNIQPPNKIKQ